MNWFKYRLNIDKVGGEYELETRFILYKKFNKNSIEAFIRRLNSDKITRIKYESYTEVIPNKHINRLRIYDGKKEYSIKEPLAREENKEYRASLNYSLERPVEHIDFLQINLNTVEQTLIEFDTFIVDIKSISDEINVEVEHKFYNPNQINKDLTYVQQKLYESDIIYPFYEYQRLLNLLYRNLGAPFHRYISNAVNLEYKNLRYGDLIGNDNIRYSISIKADGIRVFLCIYDNYIWQISNSGNTFTKLQKAKVRRGKREFFIIEGELIDNKHLLYYDLVVIENEDNTNLYDRLEYIDKNIHKMGLKVYTYSKKPFYKIHTVDEFYDKNIKLIHSKEFKKSDGLIYTPDNISYRDFNKFKIYKWKPRDLLTIDFYVSNDGVLSINEGEKIIPFTTKVNGEKMTFNIDPKYANSIVEILFSDTYEPIVFRVRDDKFYSNSRFVVEKVFSLLISNIDINTLLGNDIRLLRRYHNRVKRELLDYSIDNTNNSKILLDIGSGRGGDISKWKNFKTIYAIEPNKDNYEELLSRLSLSNIENKVVPMNIKIQDLDMSSIEKPNVVSSMISSSLIDIDVFMNILGQLDNGTMFIALLITKEATDAFKEDIGDINSGPISIKFRNKGEIFINIEDTIVDDQIEHPKSVLEFQALALRQGYFIDKLSIVNREKLLNKHEKLLLPLYAEMIMMKKDKLTNKEIQEFINNPSVRNDPKYYV